MPSETHIRHSILYAFQRHLSVDAAVAEFDVAFGPNVVTADSVYHWFEKFNRSDFNLDEPPLLENNGNSIKSNSLVQKQRDFFDTGATSSVEFRKKQLEKLREVVVTNRQKYVDAIYKDLRRPKQYCEKSEEPFGTTFIYKLPLGVILNISPFNFPINLAIRPMTAALAAGNTVVLKPSENSENSSAALAETLNQAFPPVRDAHVSQSLLEERYDHIFYTGSPEIGRVIMSAAAQHLTPVTLELGGKCPCVILDTPDVEKVAQSLVNAKWMNCGQVCLAVDYVLLTPQLKEKFIEARVMNMIKKTNGKLIYKSEDQTDHDDKYIGPHVYEVQPDDQLMQDEVFGEQFVRRKLIVFVGPVLSILTIDDLDSAIKFINRREKPLGAYVYTSDDAKAERFFQEVHCALNIPFGGVGQSGMGRYHGIYGFKTFTHEKATVRSHL
ncbi:Aldehyde dehydrogenase [Aphelenchoides besseyi]|nr:Aldehyde dehydrogenase [Aphelenchoides besseyi]